MPDKFESLETRIDEFVRRPANLLFVAGGALLVFSAWLWWTQVYSSPYRVFWGMLGNNLAVQAVHEQFVSKPSNGIQVSKQTELTFGAVNQAHITTRTSATQTGTVVNTETLATPKQEFNRYTSISSKQLGADGRPLNFGPILGKWAETDSTGANNFSESILQANLLPMFPLANVAPAGRQQLLRYLHDNVVYTPDYAVKRSRQNGRPRYTYHVSVAPVAYVAFLKAVASQLGLSDLNQADPNDAQGSSAVPLDITVDVWSRQLVQVSYPSQYTVSYDSYGVGRQRANPKPSISSQQLQAYINQLK